jgi:hypothetical protein
MQRKSKGESLNLTLSDDEIGSVDLWRALNGGVSRNGAVRELLRLGLSIAYEPRKPRQRPRLIVSNS